MRVLFDFVTRVVTISLSLMNAALFHFPYSFVNRCLFSSFKRPCRWILLDVAGLLFLLISARLISFVVTSFHVQDTFLLAASWSHLMKCSVLFSGVSFRNSDFQVSLQK